MAQACAAACVGASPGGAAVAVKAEAAAVVAELRKKARPRQAAAAPSLAEGDLPALRRKAQRVYDTLVALYVDPPCPLVPPSPSCPPLLLIICANLCSMIGILSTLKNLLLALKPVLLLLGGAAFLTSRPAG